MLSSRTRTRGSLPLPLALFVCSILFFSAHVLATTSSAVLGIDLGTGYIKAALVKPGSPIEIVLTKDSRRKELAAVAFKPGPVPPVSGAFPERAYGSDAAALAARFPSDVYPNLKTLLGLVAEDEPVREYKTKHPALRLEPAPGRGTVAFRSDAFASDDPPWSVEELLAMQLQSVRKNAEAAAGAGSVVQSAVLTVPPFYTAEERRAVRAAAHLAGLRVLTLMSDGLAVGLHYATTRQFANVDEGGKPAHHLVLDMGAGSTKATVMRFRARSVRDVGKQNKTVQEVRVLASSWDRTLGGDGFNSLIVDDMVARFVESAAGKAASATEPALRAHGRAMAKLVKEAERLRQILSANSNTAGSLEDLYEGADLRYKLSRADFEKMTAGHASRVGRVVKEALEAAGVDGLDIESVILHGGASRTPFVQKALEDALGSADKVRTNVNSDEAAALGAGFRAADLSPGFRVKEIRVAEGAAYAAGMRWAGAGGKLQRQRLWSAASPLGGPPKEVTFNTAQVGLEEGGDLDVTFYQLVDGQERDTLRVSTKNLTATAAELGEKHGCASEDIRVKVTLKLGADDAEVAVVKAQAECETEAKEGFVDGVKNLFGFGKKDQVPLKEGDADPADAAAAVTVTEAATSSGTSSSASTPEALKAGEDSSSLASAATSAQASPEPGPKKQVLSIPLQFAVEKMGIPQPTGQETQAAKSRLRAFEASDRNRLAREDSLNQLEAFAYKVRDLLDGEAFVAASTAEERRVIETKARLVGDWLYGDGVDATREELRGRLDELKALADPIQTRIREAEERPGLVAALKETLNQTTTFIEGVLQQVKEYEAWQTSQSAEAAASGSSSSLPVTASMPSPAGFAGLEDDDDKVGGGGGGGGPEELLKKLGPAEPIFSIADIAEVEGLYAATQDWLRKKEKEQAELGPASDPVMMSRELQDRREKLSKATMELAMKGLKSFEPKVKKMSQDAAARAKKTKKATAASSSSSSTDSTATPSGSTGRKAADKGRAGGAGAGNGQPAEKKEKIKADEKIKVDEKDEL